MSDVTLQNVSPVGALDVPIAHVKVEAGGTFTVPADIAALLLAQPDNFVEIKPAPPVVTKTTPNPTVVPPSETASTPDATTQESPTPAESGAPSGDEGATS